MTGFSIPCYAGDQIMAGACINSLRTFCGDVPICIIADDSRGRVRTKSWERHYGVQVIRKEDVRNPQLRQHSFGYGLTKMVALWEAPFDEIIHIDADTVVWGDIRENMPAGAWDVVHNQPHEEITESVLRKQYFDPGKLFAHYPEFPWRGLPFFNAGIFRIRRGCLDVGDYLRLLEIQRRCQDALMMGEQGILNVLVFSSAAAGRIRVTEAPLQTVVPTLDRSIGERTRELEMRFRFHEGVPLIDERPSVIHWAGPKPWHTSPDLFSAPMDYFRQQDIRTRRRLLGEPASSVLSLQELVGRWLPQVPGRVRAAVRLRSRLTKATTGQPKLASSPQTGQT